MRLRGVSKKSLPGQPLITVITSTFNAAAHLPHAVRSIRGQTYKHIEWLIADGGSTDGTVELLRANDDVIDYWLSEPDSGIYDAWNKALRHVKGSWVVFMGADDQLDAAWLQKVAAQDLHYDLVYSNLQLLDSGSGRPIFLQRGVAWKVARRLLRQFSVLPHPGLAHAVRLFEGNDFDARFGSVADWEFLVRTQPQTGLYIEDGVQASMTLGGVSNTAAGMTKAIEEYFAVVKAHHLKLNLSVRLSKMAKLWISHFPGGYAMIKNAYFRLHSHGSGHR